MANNRLSFFFKNVDGYGWSEQHWLPGSFPEDPTIPPVIVAFAQARMGVSTTSVTLTHIRINYGSPRLVQVFAPNSGAGIVGTETTPTAGPEQAVMVRWSNAALTYARTFVRGVPQRVIASADYLPDAAFIAEMNAYIQAAFAAGIVVQGYLGTPGVPTKYPIDTLIPSPPRGFTGVIHGGLVPQAGDVLRIHGAKVPGYNGLKTVVYQSPQAPGNTDFGGAAPAANETSQSVFVTVPVLNSSPITTANVEGASIRRAGRPFGLVRGRKQTLYPLR